ncbi:MAG: hypothetical protein ACRD1F_11935, partial [Terriglobales bacterium]
MAAPTGSEFAAWLGQQRWYGAKSASIASVTLADRIPELALLDVALQAQPPARYAVPEYGGSAGLADAAARERWFLLLAQGARVPGTHGRFDFDALAPLEPAPTSRLLGAEQSNTSILYTDAGGQPRWILKLIRRIHPGENPDFEIPLALARHTAFGNVPAAAARLRYRTWGGETATIAVMQSYIPNHGDGWEYFLSRLRSPENPQALLEDLEWLGRRTAELHCALASIRVDAGFTPEAITPAGLERWRNRALAGIAAAPPADQALLAPWRERLTRADAGLTGLLGCHKIRIHGDFHLGQTLKTDGDFYLFDFEGEPARPLAERRQKGTVLQDVAGMLRSLGYAAHTASRPEWEALARHAFLRGYRTAIVAAPLPLAPQNDAAFRQACA